MSGLQFLHLQSYSCEPNKIGESVQQVLDEAARESEFAVHVENPMPPKIIYGFTPNQVREKHDEIVAAGYVEATLKDATVARRGIRKDRHTLLTAVASYPLPTAQVADGAATREEYERWVELNVRWLKDAFGDQLVSVIEHMDEEHPHIHAFILPLGDPSCSARHLNPAWQVKEETEALARENGKPTKEAVKLGNRAYRARGRELQDLRLQDTRGTAATRLLKAGLSLNQIANHMGWSLRYAAGVIEHYAAVSPTESAEVLDLLKREKQRREGKIVNATVNAPFGAQRGDS